MATQTDAQAAATGSLSDAAPASASSHTPMHPDCPCSLDSYGCCCLAARPLRHSLTLVPRWFECTADGRKSFEGRLCRADLAFAQAGDELVITPAAETLQQTTTQQHQQQQTQSQQQLTQRSAQQSAASPQPPPALLIRRVLSVRHFPDFPSALQSLPLDRTLPGVLTLEEGDRIYREFYPEALQRAWGVLFIESVAVAEHNPHAVAKTVPMDAEIESPPAALIESSAAVAASSSFPSSSASAPHVELDEWHRIAAARMQLRDRLRGSSGSESAMDPQRVQSIMDELGARWKPATTAAAGSAAAAPASASASAAPASARPRMLSFWLQADPSSAVGKQLAACVQSLSAARSQAPFGPHITLCSFPWGGESEGEGSTSITEVMAGMHRALASVLSPGHSLRVRVEQLGTHPTLPFVTLVLMLERTDALIALRQAIYEQLLIPMHRREKGSSSSSGEDDAPSAFPYMPHLSLLYDTAARCSALDRQRIVERDCIWDGVRGRTSFQNLQFDVGRISLIETTDRDYARWITHASIDLPTGLPPQSLSLPNSLRAQSTPLSPSVVSLDSFRRGVVDRLEHGEYLRATFELAEEAKERGDGPFGAVLVCDGQIVMCASNRARSSVSPHVAAAAEDCTAHAEMELLRLAARCDGSGFFRRDRMRRMILYTSAEPCPMCAGAIVLSGIRAVVFGISAKSLDEANPGRSHFDADLPSPLKHARLPMIVVGPMLEDQAREAMRTKEQAAHVVSSICSSLG